MPMRRDKFRRLYPLLKIISSLPPDQRQTLYKYLTHEGCEAIYECVHNSLHNPTLPHDCQAQIKCSMDKHKTDLRSLINEANDPNERKALLQKVHAPVGTLLSYVFPLLTEEMEAEAEFKKKKRVKM